jgi:hypothetical protein
MKAKEVKCAKCEGTPKLCGSGNDDFCMEGPLYVRCVKCGSETSLWAYARECWKEWKNSNLTPTK